MALRIKEILQEQGKKNKWLAEQLGITEPGLWLIMTEKVNVPLRRLEQIAEILGVSTIELFDDYKDIQTKVIADYKKLQEENSYTISCPHCKQEINIIVTAK